MRTARRWAVGALVPMLAGCAALNHGFLNAQGPVADHERHLFYVACRILIFVAAPVLILVPSFAYFYRLSNTTNVYRPKWAFSWPLEGFIWLPPIGIVILLAFILWPATHRDDPYIRIAGHGAPLHIQAIALDWKWVFIYPDQGIATVNQLAVPVGQPVALELTSGTVMQSLLLPQLAGQIYAMAGMRTRLNFAVDRPGRTLGENVQFNGNKFAQQKFPLLAMSAGDYAAWLARTRAANRPLDAAAWRSLSARSTVPRQVFSAVPAGFFAGILAADGGRSHVHPIGPR